jgi:hypothetical protein
MDRAVRGAIKHQQMAAEASFIEWRRRELSANWHNRKVMEKAVFNK